MNYRLHFCCNLSRLVPESHTKGKIQEPMSDFHTIEKVKYDNNQSGWLLRPKMIQDDPTQVKTTKKVPLAYTVKNTHHIQL